jgi:hypothetical protein
VVTELKACKELLGQPVVKDKKERQAQVRKALKVHPVPLDLKAKKE